MVPNSGLSLEDLSDEDLVRCVCNGDEDALVHLVVDRFGGLIKMIRSKFHYDGDLTQDVCVHLFGDGDWARLRSWQGTGLTSWLRSLATRICLNQYQTRKKYLGRFRRLTHEDDPTDIMETSTSKGSFLQEARISKLLLAIGKLSPRHQIVISSHVLGELSIEELAEFLQVRLPAARTIKSRAIQQLRELLLGEERTNDVLSPN